MSLTTEQRAAIEATLEKVSGTVLEAVADQHGVKVIDVIDCLPANEVTTVDAEHFEAVMTDLTEWGDITFIVHTADLVFEARGQIPQGSMGHGYYNLHGKPIGGHLRANRCARIAFVSRLLFGKPSRSVQFYSVDGDCMFKIYLGRDADGAMYGNQIARFNQLATRLTE